MRGGLATLAVTLFARGAAAQPGPETMRAFDRYSDAVAARVEVGRGTAGFLKLGADAGARARLRAGDVETVAADTLGLRPAIAIPGGQVQHWVGAAFMPGMTIKRALPALRDYNNRKREMAPVIVESRILSGGGDEFRVWLRLQQRAILPAVFDLILRIRYRAREDGELVIESRTESVREVPGVNAPRGADARDRGLMWALDDYWRFAEGDGGVYVECEALVLSRPTPSLLRWIADPLVARASRRTLEATLKDTVRMVERGR